MISKEEYEMLISKGNTCLDINYYEKACFYFNKAADNYSEPAEAHFGLMFAVSYNHPRHLVSVCERYCRELFGCWAANKMNAHFNLAKKYCKKGSALEKTLKRMDYLVETFFELNYTYDCVVGTRTSNYKKFLKIKDDFEKITDKDVRNSELFKNLQFMWEFERPTVEWRYKNKLKEKLSRQTNKKT